MATYGFILGKTPLLSLVEIFNRLAALSAGYKIVDLTSQALVIGSDGPFEAAAWQRNLGGCLKIGEIAASYKGLPELIQHFTKPTMLQRLASRRAAKMIFGFSLYGDLLRGREGNEFNAIGLRLKKELQKNGVRCRFVAAKEGALTSVQVTKNKLIENGADILIISGLSSLYLGRTLAVQEFEEYSYRDYGRPRRDSRAGMLPPKLAKIMINLARVRADQHLLDPFCGSGTVLQEALLMGIQQITGSDISQKAISDSQQNLDWLFANNQVKKNNVALIRADVSSLDTHLKPASVDVVVTEPYLGPTISKNTSLINMLALIQELETLYLAAFKMFGKLIKRGSRIVIVFPLFKTVNGIFSLKILEQLETMGFARQNPFPDTISLFAKIGPTARGSLIYSRPDQRVEREIFIFQYKKSGV